MLKLKFSKPFHKQYLDGKISVCKYNCTVYDNSSKKVILEFTTTGNAKCAPNDTVDPEFGSKLADSRAKLIAYKVAANLISTGEASEIAETIMKQIELLEFIDQMHYLKKKEIAHIEDICVV